MAWSELDIAEVSIDAQFDQTEQVSNVFQFQMATPTDPSDAAVIDDLIEIAGDIIAIIKVMVTALTTWQSIRVRRVNDGQVFGVVPLASPVAGTLAGDPGASQVAGLLVMSTGISRVSLRKYVGPVGETALGSTGFLAGNAITALGNLGDYLLPTISATNANWVYGHLRPTTQEFVRPQGYSIPLVPATQRRRRRNVGS